MNTDEHRLKEEQTAAAASLFDLCSSVFICGSTPAPQLMNKKRLGIKKKVLIARINIFANEVPVTNASS